MKNITDSIVEETKKWLDSDGRVFFTKMILVYGEISPVYLENELPHAVHFREGMQVRNFLRSLDECKDWSTDDYDNNWQNIVRKAIS